MTSERQFAANRRNAARSTGPRTSPGKLQSRQNACRHGLTAETVIASLEDPGAYRNFETGLFQDYDPSGAVECELVARLSSLLWRLRRATLIETGLFEMQGRDLQQRCRGQGTSDPNSALSIFYRILLGAPVPLPVQPEGANPARSSEPNKSPVEPPPGIDAASIYQRLQQTSPEAIKRLGRYETALWRQVAQILMMLTAARRTRWPS